MMVWPEKIEILRKKERRKTKEMLRQSESFLEFEMKLRLWSAIQRNL